MSKFGSNWGIRKETGLIKDSVTKSYLPVPLNHQSHDFLDTKLVKCSVYFLPRNFSERNKLLECLLWEWLSMALSLNALLIAVSCFLSQSRPLSSEIVVPLFSGIAPRIPRCGLCVDFPRAVKREKKIAPPKKKAEKKNKEKCAMRPLRPHLCLLSGEKRGRRRTNS